MRRSLMDRDDIRDMSSGNCRKAGRDGRKIQKRKAKRGKDRLAGNPPAKMPMRMAPTGNRWRDTFDNWHLAHLDGFLHKSVGRPWNDVYSELVESMRGCGSYIRHTMDHVLSWKVEHHVDMVNGIPCERGQYVGQYKDGGWEYEPRPVGWRKGGFYVYPEARNGGILYWAKPIHRVRESNLPTRIYDGRQMLLYEMVNNTWFSILRVPILVDRSRTWKDEEGNWHTKYWQEPGVSYIHKQLNKRELRRFYEKYPYALRHNP